MTGVKYRSTPLNDEENPSSRDNLKKKTREELEDMITFLKLKQTVLKKELEEEKDNYRRVQNEKRMMFITYLIGLILIIIIWWLFG